MEFDAALLSSHDALDMSSEGSDAQFLEELGRTLWTEISRTEHFKDKYGRDPHNPGVADCYLFAKLPRKDTLAFEAFASVRVFNIMKEELVYHPMFECIIERYTKTRAKPNPILMETRSADFCYRLTILVEAVPQQRTGQNPVLRLEREYSVLRHVWENFSLDLAANQCPTDLLVGIPMPFEFVNVVGNPTYDFVSQHGLFHRGIRGDEIPLSKYYMQPTNTCLNSSLSYMASEKLGPTVQYLLDLLKSQRKIMSLSTALKIYDQLLCRLMVLHKYGVILGNLDPRFLNFGVREANKVLYINRFDSALVAPTTHRSPGSYSQRCASMASQKHGRVHFVNDIECAFYLFLSLIFPILPWDGTKQPVADSESTDESVITTQTQGSGKGTNMLDEKWNFWASNSWFNRMMRHVNFETSDPEYQGFTVDLLTMLYIKTQEAIVQCKTIPHSDYMAVIMTNSSPSNSAYSNLRKIVAAYFRFEQLFGISRDQICQRKVEILLREDTKDRRILWDLSEWCWNAYYPTQAISQKNRSISMLM